MLSPPEKSNNTAIDWYKYKKTAWVSLQNQFWFGLALILFYPILIYRGVRFEMELPTINMPIVNRGHLSSYYPVYIYYIHRLLHFPIFYKRLHKIHHEWQIPVGCSAILCTSKLITF